MPMSIPGLAGEIKSAIESGYGKSAEDQALLGKFCTAIATAVVNHIKTNGTLTFAPGDIPVQVSTGSGSGANVSGPPLTGKIS